MPVSTDNYDMLEFQHIIQINAPKEPHLPHMSRAALWEGLVFRSKFPSHFTPNIHCVIEEGSDSNFIRVLHFGEHVLRERVLLQHETEIHTGPADANPVMFAESVARIEEPAPGHLIVRFSYRRDSGNSDDNVDVDEYLKSAYVQNDRDAITLIRKFSLEGMPSAESRLQ